MMEQNCLDDEQLLICKCSGQYMVFLFKSLGFAAAAKSLQSCPTLCNPIDGSPSGSPVPGILQARTLEWGAISFSNAWKWKMKVKLLSRVRLLVTPWTAAYQAPPSMGVSRQEYWSGVPLPSPTGIWGIVYYCTEVVQCDNLQRVKKQMHINAYYFSLKRHRNSIYHQWGHSNKP